MVTSAGRDAVARNSPGSWWSTLCSGGVPVTSAFVKKMCWVITARSVAVNWPRWASDSQLSGKKHCALTSLSLNLQHHKQTYCLKMTHFSVNSCSVCLSNAQLQLRASRYIEYININRGNEAIFGLNMSIFVPFYGQKTAELRKTMSLNFKHCSRGGKYINNSLKLLKLKPVLSFM